MAASAVPDDRTLRMVHTFDAAPERVFAAWTDPAQFIEWFGPHGMTNTDCELTCAWAGHGGARRGLGTRRRCRAGIRVDPPRRWSYLGVARDGRFSAPREHETIVAIDLKEVGGCTELTLTQRLFRDRTGSDNHRWGWTGSFEKLAARLSPAV